MKWTLSPDRFARPARRVVARYGLRSGIVLAGAAVALGTVRAPVEVKAAPAPLYERVTYYAPTLAVQPAAFTAVSASQTPRSLDNGVSHSRIDKWISRFANSAGFERSLNRMDKYSDMITAKLDARKMPRDLIYLAMIESDFDPNARSHVNAVGMWQFMRATAQRFGLTVRGKVDERKHPALSTDAALTYLSSLYDRFGSWYLAAAAYNSGEGRVSNALKRVTGKSKGTDADFFRIMPALPRETRDYVPKLLAAARVGKNPEKYGLGE